ncbi:MAG: hypothetical protein HY696_03290 [Deltaproteobacteria bacterium]|nr:hypothetical protein [Deltaproteobacteria bacterium]
MKKNYRRPRFVMAQITTIDKMDRSFDIRFWQRCGVRAIFATAWGMIDEARKWKRQRGRQPRLQRSVAVLKRREHLCVSPTTQPVPKQPFSRHKVR